MSIQEHISPALEKASMVFSERRTGLYVPWYQREYSWDKAQYVRLFNDFTEVMNRPFDSNKFREKYYHFFGTTIHLKDGDQNYIHPQNFKAYPNMIYNIVDGQQRITTLALLATILVKRLRSNLANIKKLKVKKEKIKKLEIQTDQLIKILSNYYTVNLMNYSTGPKIIRTKHDVWSKKYLSPIASHLWNSIKLDNVWNDIDTETNMIIDDVSNTSGEHKMFYHSLEILEELVEAFCTQSNLKSNKMIELNHVSRLETNAELQYALFGENLCGIDGSKTRQRLPIDYSNFTRALMLGYFIENCLVVVSVKVTGDYERAFAIFDSLNSTGKTLTPLECLKPAVVASAKEDVNDNMEKLEDNDKINLFMEIENEIYKITQDRQKKETIEKTIVTVFSLVLSGTVLGSDSNEQRGELVERFIEMKNPGGPDHQIEFLKLLKATVKVFLTYLNNQSYSLSDMVNCQSNEPDICKLIGDANFCINYLKESKCYLALTSITRFYYEYLYNLTDFPKITASVVSKVIRANAAFFALWQTSEIRSDGKEDVFRDAFQTPGNNKGFQDLNLIFYDFELKEVNSISTYTQLVEYYKNQLCYRKEIARDNAMTTWMNRVRSFPIYILARTTSKMFLLMNLQLNKSNDQYMLPVESIKDYKAGVIGPHSYTDASYGSIYHIIPRIVTFRDTRFERLWNLTLLPSEFRKLIDAASVAEKDKLYKFIVLGNEDEYRKEFDIDDDKMKITKELREYMGEKGIIQLISQYMKDGLTPDALAVAEKRADEIFELCWDTIAVDWLEWDHNIDFACECTD